jgi:type I site-specific restriction endonuclease
MKDADLASLRILGGSAERDQAIVRQYLRGGYGKTVVFACDIEHANKLAKAMVRRGVNAPPR